MRVAYIAPIRLPTEKAHGAQVMKACEAFARQGVGITLYVTDRESPLMEDPFDYYGVERLFPIERIRTPDTLQYGPLGFIWANTVFGLRARRAAAHADYIYCRDEFALAPIALKRRPFIWESHDGSWNIFARLAARRAEGIVVVTKAARVLYERQGVPLKKLYAVPNGIDIESFGQALTQAKARERLGIPLGIKCVMYVGRLDGWKGTDTLLAASKLFPADMSLYVVGGEPEQITKLSESYPNVQFLGPRPFKELRDVQAAADVLVVPNTAKNVVSVSYTSPLKLIAHMASERAIVASDLPSIRELVDDESAVLVTPDDPAALAKGIDEASKADTSRAQNAYERANALSWNARAKGILYFMSNLRS